MELINNNKTFIIAEAGCNHNGKISLALKLIDAAKSCGADAVKFQIFNPFRWYQNMPKRLLIQKTKKNEKQLQMQKKISLNFDEFFKLQKYARKKNSYFLFSI